MAVCNKDKKSGWVHSFETFGTLEGPGIRFVVFMQGCLARCLYCQNPDTWELNKGKKVTAKEIFEKIKNYIPYMRFSKGGVTVSGGEPLLQIEFLIDLFKLCKRASIHTAIDTSSFFNIKNKNLSKLIELTDLFIVDIKASQEDLHKKITSRNLADALFFIDMLEKAKRPYWIRYVLVPGLNNSKEDLKRLKTIMSKFKYCKKFEFLPYHALGKHKWQYLGLKYPLGNTRPATPSDIKKAEKEIR